jgi:anti-sigma B factor antagonist
MEGIEIQEYRVGALKDIVLFKTQGYIDTNTSPELQKCLSQTIDQGVHQFVIDMGGVQYVSSAGWGVFVGEIRGLQEKGGDLKITQMSPEVYEVFEMLEFHRILTSYDSIEEAVEDFDFSRNLNDLVTNSMQPKTETVPEVVNVSKPEIKIEEPPDIDVVQKAPPIVHRKKHSSQIQPVDEPNLPLNEKIKRIVLENPMLGVWSIKRMLYSPRFGYTTVGLYKLNNTLKKLSMNTKAKRFRYFRSR